MTVISLSTTNSNNSDATWRTWASSMNTCIVNSGLVYVPCTGDMQFVAEIRPAAANNANNAANTNYRIYRFNDTLQAVYPIYIKVYFGTGGGAVTNGAMYIAMGMAVNTDTGGLSGNGATSGWYAYLRSSTTISTAGLDIFSTGSGDSFSIAFNTMNGSGASNTDASFFTLERVNGGLFTATYCNYTAYCSSVFLPYTGTIPTNYSTQATDLAGVFTPILLNRSETLLLDSKNTILTANQLSTNTWPIQPGSRFIFYPTVKLIQNQFIQVSGITRTGTKPYLTLGYVGGASFTPSNHIGIAMAFD